MTARLLRSTSGGVTVELALLAVMLLTSVTLALDVYVYQRAQAGGQRLAQVLADYVANQVDPPLAYGQVEALAEAMRPTEIGTEHALVVRLTALHQPAGGTTATIPWVDVLTYGDADVASALAAACPSRDGRFHLFGEEGQVPALPTGLALAAGDDVVVAQICARLTDPGIAQSVLFDEVIYRIRVLPFNEPQTRPPPAPAGRPAATPT